MTKRCKNITFDENYFECVDTEDKAYFLGFISADGCVRQRTKKCKVLIIHIHKQDIDILVKFKNAINFSGEFSMCNVRSNMCTMSCHSIKMVDDLAKYNVTPNKTRILKFPILPENLINHYMRGYFDGDGCVSIHKDKRFENGDRGQINLVSASYVFIKEYVDILINKCGVKNNSILDRNTKGSYYVIDWGKLIDVENIYYFLYKDAKTFLNRKKEKYDKVMEINLLKKRYRKNKQIP
jgi:hypothetical protein